MQVTIGVSVRVSQPVCTAIRGPPQGRWDSSWWTALSSQSCAPCHWTGSPVKDRKNIERFYVTCVKLTVHLYILIQLLEPYCRFFWVSNNQRGWGSYKVCSYSCWSLLVRCFDDWRLLFPCKGFNGDHRNSAAVLGTRSKFSFTLPELTVSVTALPLCSV